jgi:hypothetical protein
LIVIVFGWGIDLDIHQERKEKYVFAGPAAENTGDRSLRELAAFGIKR